MPRPKPPVETVGVLLRLHPDVLAAIDKLRGETSRAAWIMACIGRDLGDRSARAAELKAAKREALSVPPKAGRLTLADVRPTTKTTRLKGEWKAP